MNVSVIITSYNQKEYLEQALESVINQTVEPYEIIVVDDCSSDGSQNLIEKYADRYPDLIRAFYHDENLGIPKNRNFALERVEGDYVSILDGDDRFISNKIERELEELNNQSAAVYSNFYYIDEKSSRYSLRYNSEQPSGEIFPEVFTGQFGMLRSMLIDYNALTEIGFMNEEYWHYDGFDLTIRLAKEYPIKYLHEPLAEIRMHEGGASGWRQASDLLPELKDIYNSHKHDIEELPKKRQHTIESKWAARLAKFEARTARERGEYFNALRQYLRSALNDPTNVLNYKKIVKYILPSPVYSIIRQSYWQYHGWSL